MPVNYDRAVSRAAVFDRARNRDFEFDTTALFLPLHKPRPKFEDTVWAAEMYLG